MARESASPPPSPPDRPKLLVVEDDEELRSQMKWALGREYHVLTAEDRVGALEILRAEEPALVTLDLGLPPDPAGAEEGFRTLTDLLALTPHAKVVVITGRAERENALRAVAQGAYDYFSKPIEIQDLRVVLGRALYLHGVEAENRRLRAASSQDAFEGMLGASQPMQEVFAKIRKVATTEAPVLLVGESGTGKELAARAIHRLGPRGRGPFVAINCGAIPETLLESELFGHEKGSFTGAHVQRKGRVEMAQGGTLFLDEVGELSPMLQVKLLRFLQEQRIERVGGREEIAIDARVMAATNADLQKAMEEGRFRQDLYYRLGVVVIALPPLRERPGDVELLARALVEKFSVEGRKRITGFTAAALKAMVQHRWTGNVRELENRLRRAVIMAEGTRLTPEDLELASKYARYEGLGLREAREGLERELILQAVAHNQGNLTQAAADLGISRPTLYDLMDMRGMGNGGGLGGGGGGGAVGEEKVRGTRGDGHPSGERPCRMRKARRR